MSRDFRYPVLATTATSLLFTIPSAFAQDYSQANAILEEIIVTAERRASTLQETPVSIVFVSGDTLSENNITTQADLGVSVPGLNVQAGVSSNQINYVLRGQSTDPFSNTRPGVLPYFNNVQIGGAVGASSFYDLESVQILKGPQGTLFGRNSTGGALLFTTRGPEDERGGYLSVGFGNYDTTRAEGAVNLPISESVGLRLAGFYENQDEGFQRNILLGEDLGTRDRFGIRASLSFDIGDSVTNDLVVDYFEADETNIVPVLEYVDPSFPVLFPAGVLVGPTLDQAIGFSGAWDLVLANNPSYPAGGLIGAAATQRARTPYEVETQALSGYEAENILVTNTTIIDVGELGEIRNIIGYADFDYLSSYDPFGSPFVIFNNDVFQNEYEGVTEELQLYGTAGDLEYTVGAYFSAEESNWGNESPILDLGPVIPATRQFGKYVIENTSYAGYAQLTYRLNDKLALTLGGRLSREDVELEQLPGGDFREAADAGLIPGLEPIQDRSIENFSWTGRLEYTPTENVLTYVVSRRSFRNGGYNGTVAPFPGVGKTGGAGYETEQLTDVEAGVKYNVGLFRFSAAAYQSWIKDNQRTVFTADRTGNASALTVNVPEAEVSGVELEASIGFASGLQLGGSLVYTDAEYTDGNVLVLGTPLSFDDYPFAPEWAASAFLQYDTSISDGVELTLRAEGVTQSSFFYSSASEANPRNELDGYSLANFRAALRFRERFTINANVRNAFDETYLVGGIDAVTLGQASSVIPGLPRTYSVEARYEF